MRRWLIILALLTASRAFADVSVSAVVDRNRIALGDSAALTVTVQGAPGVGQPQIPAVDGLAFSGPAMQQSMSIVNGQMSQSVGFTYQVTPSRLGEFAIPAIEVNVDGKVYRTEPIKLVVEKGAVPNDLSQHVFVRVQMPAPPVYLGQVAPLDVLVFARVDVPLRGLAGFTYQADGLGYKFLPNLKSGTQVISGETFNVHVIEGAIAPQRAGALAFGPAVVKGQLAVQKRGGDPFFNPFFSNVEVRELPLTVDATPIEVLPLPEEGRPADFAGAVGQWKLEVTAKPTDVAVGDPITLTIKISGAGNIDLVPTPKLTGLEEFKTYDPTVKTTKNDLNTTGERVIQQVLVARSPAAKQLPEVRLAYFDPAAKKYQVAVQPPVRLVVKAGSAGPSTIVGGGSRRRPDEKLGQDIVYLKGDLGPAAVPAAVVVSLAFWLANLAPVLALLGGMGWKRRADRLRGDVAYARRSRAARSARKLLAAAASCDQIQRALQSYLGDRLNIPAAGITASVVDEQLVPRGVETQRAAELRKVFETCDTVRFAGASGGTDVAALRETVERLIDELENQPI